MDDNHFIFAFYLRHEEKLKGRTNYMNWSIRLKTMLCDKEIYKKIVLDLVALDPEDDASVHHRRIEEIAMIQANVSLDIFFFHHRGWR